MFSLPESHKFYRRNKIYYLISKTVVFHIDSRLRRTNRSQSVPHSPNHVTYFPKLFVIVVVAVVNAAEEETSHKSTHGTGAMAIDTRHTPGWQVGTPRKLCSLVKRDMLPKTPTTKIKTLFPVPFQFISWLVARMDGRDEMMVGKEKFIIRLTKTITLQKSS